MPESPTSGTVMTSRKPRLKLAVNNYDLCPVFSANCHTLLCRLGSSLVGYYFRYVVYGFHPAGCWHDGHLTSQLVVTYLITLLCPLIGVSRM